MDPSSSARRTRVLAMLAGLLLLTACQGSTGTEDTAGGDNVVLHLASIDAVNVDGHSFGPQTFVDSLASVSAGRLTAQVTEGYGDDSADVETFMVKDIASGKVDGGWPALRAFAAAGMPGLRAVEAPLTITSYAAEIELVSGPVADHLLQQLAGTGIVGLGLIRGPLRRPFAAHGPLISPADWAGAPFRVFNSPVQAEVVSALGAAPVNVGGNWIDSVMAGTLRGGEFNVVQYWSNGLTTEAGNVTSDVVLWPRPSVLSLSQQRYDSLTAQQQQWVQDAARQAVLAAGNTIDDESFAANQLCLQGVRFFLAGPDQIRVLQSKVQPVIDALAADPTSGPLLKEIQAIAANHPTTDVPIVAADCATTGGTVTATGP